MIGETAVEWQTLETATRLGQWTTGPDSAPGRTRLRPGDHMCFYATREGIIAEATAASEPHLVRVDALPHPERFPWGFQLTAIRRFFETPVVINTPLRSRLDAFKGHDPATRWGWFVSMTRIVTPHDFDVLVGRA